MKKTQITLFGISVFAGAGYATWVFSPIGKNTLAVWMIKKWKQMAAQKNKSLDHHKLVSELKKLNYHDHELLIRYTYYKSKQGKKRDKKAISKLGQIEQKIEQEKLFRRADLGQIEQLIKQS